MSSSAAAPETLDGYLHVALRLAHSAGGVLLRAWRLHPNDRAAFDTKSSSADVVTETDRECERLIFRGLESVYPHHRLLGEESDNGSNVWSVSPDASAVTWVVDPVDGTNNLVHQQPAVAVSIGVLKGRESVVGVIHCPVTGETFYATKGGGAWKISGEGKAEQMAPPTTAAGEVDLSGATRLRVSNIRSLTRACVATEMGYSRSAPLVALMQSRLNSLLTQRLQSLRMQGSCCCNLTAIASGRLDAYYEGFSTTSGPKPWDLAAGSVILTEAGGVLRDPTGGPFSLWSGRLLAAANEEIAEEIAAAMRAAQEEWAIKFPESLDEVIKKPGAGLASDETLKQNAKL